MDDIEEKDVTQDNNDRLKLLLTTSRDSNSNVVDLAETRNKREKEQLANDADLAEIIGQDPELAIEELNKKYAFIENYGDKPVVMYEEYDPVFDTQKYRFISPDSFKTIHSNQSVLVGRSNYIELGRFWLMHAARRDYKGVIFDPSLPREYKGYINTWRGFAIQPAKGSWKKTRRHIYKILCNSDKEKFLYVLRWFAWLVQNPGQQAEVALVFKGKQGSGKGFIFNQFAKIFGDAGVAVSSIESITGKYNELVAKSVFVFADEAFAAGDKTSENVLKALLTESFTMSENKYKAAGVVKNFMHMVMASNEEWVVPVSSDSRRFFINEATNIYAKGQCSSEIRDKYFDLLFNEMHNGGTAAMLFDLLRVKLDTWHPRKNVPDTKEASVQKFITSSRADKRLYFMLSEGIFPGIRDEKTGKLIVAGAVLQEYLNKNYPEGAKVSTTSFAKALAEFGVTKVRKPSGNVWEFPELNILRRQWNVLKYLHEFEEPHNWRLLSNPNF